MKRALVAVATVVLAACSGSSSTVPAASQSSPTTAASGTTTIVPTTGTTTTASITTVPPRPTAPNGRPILTRPATPAAVAQELVETDRALRRPGATTAEQAEAGRRQQLAYGALIARAEWDQPVADAVPAELRPRIAATVKAQRAYGNIPSGFAPTRVPAWEIVAPEPLEKLLASYREAERATGIGWHYLAAINMVETGFGRIRGLSSAGAQGPMQFLPSTWNEPGIGRGDINDPHDSIQAAARYLVRRGGPADMRKALFGYNNHNSYVEGVSLTAEVIRTDEHALAGFYNWEIYFSSGRGSLWLPAGLYKETSPILIDDWLAKAPWSVIR